MKVPYSWLRAHVALADDVTTNEVARRLTAAGLKVEHIDRLGGDVEGVVVAKVLAVEDLTEFKKPIRWVTLNDGTDERQVICGATNFVAGDVIAYARPPAMLPGGFAISKRTAYGRESDGMICSARELGLGDDHTGIMVLDPSLPLGVDVVDALSLRDDVLDVNVNPDRGYALSIRGVAREVAIAFGLDFDDPADIATPMASADGYPVVIDDPAGCDRYVLRVITGLDVNASSPAWMQRRLTLAGMRPISLAVDVTNHVMLELGQPLHAFDRDRLSGQIVVRRSARGERLRTLDDVDRTLDEADLLITDDSGPIAIAGVMGGASTEIHDGTSAVVLESAHFDPIAVAYTARRHKLMSEASRRFERGVDTALAPAAAEAAVALLTQLGGAKAEPAATDVDVRVARPSIRLDPQLPGRLGGLELSADVVRTSLAAVGCGVSGDDPLDVTAPTWRPDLNRPEDLVEEVLRLHGYEHLPSTVPAAPAGRGLTRLQRQRRAVGRALADAGYAEVVTSPFVAAASADALLLDEKDGRQPAIRVANPVSDEEPFLRATLLPGLLAAVARNSRRGLSDVSLFEMGSVFRSPQDERPAPRLPAAVRPADAELEALQKALPYQPLHVGVALSGLREPAGWWGAGRAASWADAVEAARTVAAALGVELEVKADEHAPWHPGRCAALTAAGRLVGHAGELHPRCAEAFDLPERTCAAEIRLDELFDLAPEISTARPLSAFPAALLDVALVVPADVPAAEVDTALRQGAGELLEDLRLFDVFTGPQVGDGNKSLAFRLRLRAVDRTLTADEAGTARDAAVAEAARRFGAVLRGPA
jgi:phenylalanyl-tRNA synthetase beta chain